MRIEFLDDLDKELNNYAMRCREWYGWHFPELGKIISDHMAFAKVCHMHIFKLYKNEIRVARDFNS